MSSKRMSLVESLKREKEEIDPVVEQNFLKYGKAEPPPSVAVTVAPQPEPQPQAIGVAQPEPPKAEKKPVKRSKPSKVTPVGLIPVTIRLRPEIAGALKRASLERQLAGEELFTQQDIVEQALEPWLREEGYLS
jgi:hypothetical protein